jgi:hypothetical protein
VTRDVETEVWNRACGLEPGGSGVGDVHLWWVLRVYGCACSGGVGFILDAATVEACDRAVAGCRYFGLDELGRLIGLVAGTPQDEVEDLYQAAWDEWDAHEVETSELENALARRLADSPGDFEPVTP